MICIAVDTKKAIALSNYQYKYIGHFASAREALCKSRFIGRVTQRFPYLKFEPPIEVR
ncbi:hypothetical protein [Calothrix sp. NIES-2100]|uniref:hypothetical protein n=1 Tax=Calothrix sp. NIES-2100 TaxID=1954172 RepID=UPI0030DAC239